jgi:small-conductance mechanosensitive channel
MNDIQVGEQDLLKYLKPDTPWGAVGYLILFMVLAWALSRALRAAVHASMVRKGHIDRTTISFMQQLGTALIWVIAIILYAHLIPALRSMGTALLAGASVASVVIGLAAQSTLGNLVAGIAITIYRPFRLGDVLQVAAPSGPDVGTVELISLGYTTLRSADGHMIVVPNAVAASSVTVNMTNSYSPWPLSITLRLGRDADVEEARRLATKVAAENAGEKAVLGCYLTKVDPTAITLELRLRAADAPGRDALRSTMLAALPQRFLAAKIGSSSADLPAAS